MIAYRDSREINVTEVAAIGSDGIATVKYFDSDVDG